MGGLGWEGVDILPRKAAKVNNTRILPVNGGQKAANGVRWWGIKDESLTTVGGGNFIAHTKDIPQTNTAIQSNLELQLASNKPIWRTKLD